LPVTGDIDMYGLSNNLGEILKVGSRGDEVSDVQRQLQALGFDLQIDGIYGNMTRKAVIRFQESVGLRADGIVGTNTQNAIVQALQSEQSQPFPIVEWGKQNWEYLVLGGLAAYMIYSVVTWK